MKNKITVASLNVSQAALLSGKTRETVSRAARELQSVASITTRPEGPAKIVNGAAIAEGGAVPFLSH